MGPKSSEDNSIVAKLCTRTTFHGPLDMYEARGTGRVFWFLVTAGAFAGIGYYTYQLVLQYLQNPLATSIIDIPQSKLLFPNITVCNPARYNFSYIRDNINIPPEYLSSLAQIPISEENFKHHYFRYLRMLSWAVEQYDTSDSRTMRLLYALGMMYDQMFNKTVNPSARNISQFISQATFDCPQYLTDCKFNQQPIDCCQMARKTFIDNGYCYTIDIRSNGSSLENGYQTSEGEKYGLGITVRTNMDDVMLVTEEEEEGLRVHVADYATPMDVNPVGVPLSMHAHIRVRPVHHLFNKDVDPCLDRAKPLDPYETYTPTLCEMKCVDEMTWSLCQCFTMASFVQRDDSMICSPQTMLTCVFPRMLGLANDSYEVMGDYYSCLSSECPKLCDSWSYSTYVMYTNINKGHVDYNTTDTVITKLTIYFPEMVYEEHQEQILNNVNTFVSNIGGVVGLWTGMSVLTLIQFVLILIFGPCEGNGGKCGQKRDQRREEENEEINETISK